MSASSESLTANRAISLTESDLTHRMILMLCALTMALVSMQAFAHHGWFWTEQEQSDLKGTIAKISMAPPHPSLRVKEQGVIPCT